MKFTLIATCLNEMRSLPRWRRDLEAQTRQPDEIFIVDSESSDGTTEFLREWEIKCKQMRVIVKKSRPAAARNLAVALAEHDHIVVTDMGVRLDRKWLEEIVRPFEEDPAVEVVAGSVLLDLETIRGPAARAEWYVDRGAHVRTSAQSIPGNNSMACRKSVWLKLGGLPEDLTFYADDSVFGRQIVLGGYRIVAAPKAIVYWARPSSLRAFWQEAYNYGRGDGEAYIKIPVAYRLYKRRLLPRCAVPMVTALRQLTKQLTLRRLWTALSRADVLACMWMPVLLFGKGYFFGKGFLVGDDHGRQHCQPCRARLPADART